MSNRPNLLYVFADQLRRSSLGYAGYERAITPNIDRLAAGSMDFTQAISGHPVCAPYRATLFTGKYTTSTGMVINEIRINPNQRCLGHVLTEGGYETAYIGKWHLYANELGNHYDPKNSCVPKGPDRLGFDDFWASYGFHHEYFAPHAYYHTDSPEKIFADDYEPVSQTNLAIEQLQRLSANPDKPFAMFLSLGVPHDPWVAENVPKRILDKFSINDYTYPPNYVPEDDPHGDLWAHLSRQERGELLSWMRVYDAMVASLDENIGRLMSAVKDMGLLDNTIIVFTSDHGECFGAHGRRAKNIFYEEALRVPFLVRMPGGAQAAAKTDAILNTVDLLPTLCDLLSLRAPEDIQGQSVAGVITGENDSQPDCALLQGTGAVAAWQDGYEWRGLRDKQYVYARYRVDGAEFLFDHQNDPYELHNLAGDPAHAERLERMRERMAQKMAAVNDTFMACTQYRDQWTENRLILRTATEDFAAPVDDPRAFSPIPRPEYPRPQFVRRDWMNLNGEWAFEMDQGASGRERGLVDAAALAQRILVPFCPESKLSGIGYTDFIRCVWYKRGFTLPKTAVGKRVYLNFGAVDYKAQVWVNGQSVGTHEGGYVSFGFDITDALCEGENLITVCAEDDTRSSLQPTGKQSMSYASEGCFYTRTTGIWQTVWLEWANADNIGQVRLTPDAANDCLRISAEIRGGEGCVLHADTAFKDEGATGCGEAKVTGGRVELTVPVSGKHYWSAGQPNLYDLRLLLTKDGKPVDMLSCYFGLRTIGFDGMRFMINGKPVFQRLVLDQGFYPDGIYTAPDDAALRGDIELSMAMGFNGARLHQKVFEARYLYWADRLGYLCWGEMASWGVDHTKIEALPAFQKEWLQALARDYSAPSIIGWCPFNETWDVNGSRQCDTVLAQIYCVTKAIDPTRPCIDTSGNYHVETDIHDVHDYEQNREEFARRYGPGTEPIYEKFADRQPYTPGKPVFVSEYGGIRWNPSDPFGWGYGEAPKTEEEFLTRYRGLTEALLQNPDHFGFCYTQLTDVEQEVNGLYTYQRKPKFDPALIRAINRQEAACEKEGVNR
ncbi:MAG: sulfatase-like hydrolase/transferase [Eubacteriales bacterium]|nr:sulfatase-like hydrolase/transferase [Eubacteriales bacterium]